jgi:hypothetical protein
MFITLSTEISLCMLPEVHETAIISHNSQIWLREIFLVLKLTSS